MKNPGKPKTKSITSVLTENNKITKSMSILLLILIIFGLFAFIITGLYSYGLIERELFPSFIQNIFFKTDGGDSGTGKESDDIYQYLQKENSTDAYGSDGGGYSLEITLENIKDIISKIPLRDNLYLETKVKYYDEFQNETRTEEMSLWKKGKKYKYILNENFIQKEIYINDSKNEFVENVQTGDKSKKAAPESFYFDNIPHIPNINYYFNLSESGEIVNFYLERSKDSNDSNIARIKYSNPGLDQREIIWVSLDTGIVLKVETRVGENNDLFYVCETTVKEAYYDGDRQAEASTSIHDSLFVID